MNLLSEHNRILRVGEGGSQEYFAGPNINITDHVISGKYWDNEINSAISSTSGDIVNEAFNQSTAWTEEQGYLTAHQDVSDLPYIQNSALGYNGSLISSISGDGFFAESANNSYHADDADHATYADSATHADSADFVATANFANSASSALNAEVANVAYTALTAQFLDGGWEHDVDGFITAYNNSAFAGAGGGGRYEGISPIVVNNEEMRISAKSALLGVQNPLYFVEDSETATVIGIHDSAFPTFEGTPDGKISAINGSALNADPVVDYSAGNNIDITDHIISVTGSVPSADRASYAVSATSSHFSHNAIEAGSADSATYDNLGREITATYLTAHQDVTNLPYVQNTALESNGILISGISGSGIYATSADNAFEADHAYEADYVLSGWEYDEDNRISGYQGSAFAGQGGGIEYIGIAPIVVNNVEHKISAQSAVLGVQEPLYFVEDSETATVIGISGLPEVEGVMYESALGFSDGYITSYDGSAFSAERASYAQSATSANGAVSSQTANYVISGWEKSDNKITGYNGTAFSAGSTYDVKASSNISVSTADNTFTVSGKDWQNTITAASSYAYNQATADATGKYIPYTNITTGDSGTQTYNINKGIRVTSTSGWTEMYGQNKENENEAHLQIGQNYADGHSFWAELDGAGGGILQMNWNSGTIGPNAHVNYSDGTCSALDIGNGAIVYASATSALGNNYDSHKVWQLGSYRLRFWDSAGNTAAVFGPEEYSAWNDTRDTVSANSANWGDIPTKVVATSAQATGSNILYIVTGS